MTTTVAANSESAARTRARTRAVRRDRLAGVLLPIAGVVSAIAAWWLSIIVFDIDDFLVPTPLDVVESLNENRAFLLDQTWVTLLETVQGFVLAILLGIPVAVAIAGSRIVERMIYPLLLAVNSVPKVAIAPILVVWMGFGQLPKVVMVVLLCFFPIVLSTASGLKSTPSEIAELSASLGTGRLTSFWKFQMPWALPQVFVGLKTAISLAVIGAVIAEFVGADAGLGYVIVQSGASADTALAFASMVLLSVISIALFYVLELAEKILVPWAEANR